MTTIEDAKKRAEEQKERERQNPLLKMGLGELVDELLNLKDTFRKKFVDPDFPYPENYAKYGGIEGYNRTVFEEYEQRRKGLIAELDRREQEYNSYKSPPVFG